MTRLAFGQQTLSKAKRLNCRTAKTERAGSESGRKTLAGKQSPRFGSAPLHWFKLTAGINCILPASSGPLLFIPLLALSQLRYALLALMRSRCSHAPGHFSLQVRDRFAAE